MKEEFETLGMPYDQRGKRADEFLEIFDVLFREDRPQFKGEFTKFGPVGFEPKPVNGHIPIWVGGHSQRAYERTAKYGDAWHAAFGSPEDIKKQWDGVTRECERIGRDPGEIELTALLGIEFDGQADGNGWFWGSSEQIAESLLAYKEAGITHLVCWFTGSPAKRLSAIQKFHEEVRPNFS
jgi:alkanesulfonate monooxygenase SsuD/methylene tetrahydromethanopterin reductase-like flavin-dependent oxidoreductase (luciferase family)